jgi:hypothetical protein
MLAQQGGSSIHSTDVMRMCGRRVSSLTFLATPDSHDCDCGIEEGISGLYLALDKQCRRVSVVTRLKSDA